MKNTESIAARFSKEESDYLLKLAKQHHLYQGQSSNPSRGKALHELVKLCATHGVTLKKRIYQDDDYLIKMVEQIHAAVPHLTYMNRIIFNATTGSIVQDKFNELQKEAIQFTAQTCGACQSIEYKFNSISFSPNNMKQMPIKAEESQWRSR